MGARDRLLAWIYTGPLGHLYGTLADITELWVLYLASRVRRRLRGDGGLAA
jgi:hypothetical protein